MMKTYFSFLLLFVFLCIHAQEIVDKEVFKKCKKEFSKKICLSDEDKDSVLFYLDQCPKVFGIANNYGCPWADTDGDGVLDKDDPCPDVAGPVENTGCPWPDTDGDGVLDKDDACPTVFGYFSDDPFKNGCMKEDCKKLYEEEAERLQKFKEESINVNYNPLLTKIIDGIDLSLIKEKTLLIFVHNELVICGNGQSCSHSYNYKSPIYSSDDFWNEKTIEKVFNKLKKNVIFGKRQMGAGFSLSFEDFSYPNAKRNVVEFEYFEQKFKAPIFSRIGNSEKVLKNYNTFNIDITNSLGNIVNVAYEYEYFVKKKRWDGVIFRDLERITVVKVYQYINNQWKLIETNKN